MLMRSWLQALCAAVCVLALAGCGDECVDQFDCRNKKGNPPEGKQWVCTDDHKCEPQDKPAPVGCSPECATGDFCDTSGGEPVCRTCTATQGCTSPLFCDTAANSGKGFCRACQDTVSGAGTDTGCSASAPICDAAASNGAGVCKACSDTATGNGTDSGCSAANPVCDTAAGNGAGACKACSDTATGNGTDTGCSDSAPVCDTAAGNGAGVCKGCFDSASGAGTDTGCSAANPICDTAASNGAGVCKACVDSGTEIDSGCSANLPVCDAAASNSAGVCKACTDTATGNDIDSGCSATAPVCNASAANGAGVCKSCFDSATGNGTDLGCSDAQPICNATEANGLGACRICLNSDPDNGTDVGCADTTPFCDAAASNGAGICKACTDSAQGADVDQGCSASSPLCAASANNNVGACRVCMNSATGGTTDVGCSTSNPLCDDAAASGAGVCKVCMNTASGGTQDDGCSSPTDFCDDTANSGLGACNICLPTTNEGCPGSQTCNATGTQCEGCASNNDCNTSTPVCRPPPPVSACVECVANADCSATRPTCDTTSYLCGCTGDTACADAPGNTDHCDTSANNGRGECKQCLSDAHCVSADPTHPYCNIPTATCIQCLTNLDCSLSEMCNSAGACVAPPGANPAGTSAQIQQFIDAPVGDLATPITIENAFVTYIKPAVGADAAGFFLQAEPNGPAMFVAVDATTLNLQVGDRITLTVGKVVALNGGLEAAQTLSNVTPVARGYAIQNLSNATPPGLTVDRSGANDLQTNLANYESELIRLNGTIASAASTSGGNHTAYMITTAGMTTAATTFRLRVSDTVADALDIANTCTFTLLHGPMWRFTSGTPPATTNNAQASAYYTSDLTVANCPAPKLLTAAATSLTAVVLTFDRHIDPASVLSTGEQFTFTNGLTASNAQVNGKQITVTTSTQTAGADYSVTVAATVKDTLGKGVAAPSNAATFKGYRVPAVLRINEVLPNGSSSRDLVELLAVNGGNVEGFVLQQDINSALVLATLPNATVATGDIIVVHITPPTTPAYVSETTAKDQFPTSSTSINYDTAWDFAGNAVNITFSNRVILIKDAVGAIQDAVPFVKTDLTTPPGGYPANLMAIQAAGQWLPADCSGAPCDTTPAAQTVSADWTTATGGTATSNTARRISATDTNTKADWAVGAHSWGLPNP